jgi:glucose-6-phosphate isomerase
MNNNAAVLWKKLSELPQPTLRELFSTERDGGEGADEPGGDERVEMFSGRIELDEGGILFDWSKTHLDRAVLALCEEVDEPMD